MTTAKISTVAPKKSLLPLILLACLFGLPPTLGWIYHLNPDLLPTKRKNNGTLIQPPKSVSGLNLKTLQGQPFDWRKLADKWTMVVIGREQCDADCTSQLEGISRLRRAQRVGQQRMNLLLLLLSPDDTEHQLKIPADAKDTLIAIADPHTSGRIEDFFHLSTARIDSHFFTIDPQGNLMMRHDTESLTPKQVLADLKVLLTASENWVSGK